MKDKAYWMQVIGRNMLRYMRARGWSASRLSRECDLGQSTISLIARGKSETPISTLSRIATALDVSLWALLDEGEGDIERVAAAIKALPTEEQREILGYVQYRYWRQLDQLAGSPLPGDEHRLPPLRRAA